MKTKKPVEENQDTTQNPEISESNVTMESLTSGESLPDVNHAAVEAVKQAEREEAERKAREAASAPHGLKKDGTPAKKRGRQPKNQGAAPLGNPAPLNLAGDLLNPRPSLPAAITVSTLLEQMQVAMISPEFKYDDMEKQGNIAAWEKTFDHYGGIKIHPAVELAMSHASIIAVRATKGNETKTKLQHFKVWLSSKFKRKNKGEEHALSSDRENAQRENDIRGKENQGNMPSI